MSLDLNAEREALETRRGSAVDDDSRKYFTCEEDRDDVPAYAKDARRAPHLRALRGDAKRCAPLGADDRAWLQADIAEARTQHNGEYLMFNLFNQPGDANPIMTKKTNQFSPQLPCAKNESGGLDENAFVADLYDQCHRALVRKAACDRIRSVFAQKCRDALVTRGDDDDEGVTIKDFVYFADLIHATYHIDDVPMVVTIDATADANAIGEAICVQRDLHGEWCDAFKAAIRNDQPPATFLEDRPSGWTYEAWLAEGA